MKSEKCKLGININYRLCFGTNGSENYNESVDIG